MIEALDHLNVGGPDAVRKAAEALAVAAILYEADSQDVRPVIQKLKQTAKTAWVLFTVASSVPAALLTWDKIVDLPLIDAGAEQRQLPPGSLPGGDSGEAPGSPAH